MSVPIAPRDHLLETLMERADLRQYVEEGAAELMTDWLLKPLPRYAMLYTAMEPGGSPSIEVQGNSYQRARLYFEKGPDGNGAVAVNDAVFPKATGPWGTVTHVGIGRHRVVGHGNIYFWAVLPSPQAVSGDDIIRVPRDGVRLYPTDWLLAQLERSVRANRIT